MTLAELLTTLETARALKVHRIKDYRTAFNYLGAALGYKDNPGECPLEVATREVDAWLAALEAHWQALTAKGRTISAGMRSNNRNHLRVVFRAAEAHGLLAAPLPQPFLIPPRRVAFERQQRETAPYQAIYHPKGPRRYGLPKTEWPPDVLAGWKEYQLRCGLRLRPATFVTYEKCMASYLGYLTNIEGRTVTWDELFALPTIRAFLHWHRERLGRTLGVHGYTIVAMLAAMAIVLEHPEEECKDLADFRNGLTMSTPVHIKEDHWVPLKTLEAVADALLAEGRLPYVPRERDKYPGCRRATHFQRGVMLKILIRIPLRQRNLREMKWKDNLYEGQDGHWHLRFRGEELKIGKRGGKVGRGGGRVNEYHVDLTEYCPDLLLLLDDWRTVYRPRLPGAETSPFLFLTYRGNAFTQRSLNGELGGAVTRHTGRRFYVHLIRTIWATEYLKHPDTYGDYQGAAMMLGDTVGVVIKSYSHLFEDEVRGRHKGFLAKALRAG